MIKCAAGAISVTCGLAAAATSVTRITCGLAAAATSVTCITGFTVDATSAEFLSISIINTGLFIICDLGED